MAADWAMDDPGKSDVGGVSSHAIQSFEAELVGHSYDLRLPDEKSRFLLWLVATWSDPWRVLHGIEEVTDGIVAPKGAIIPEKIVALPPVWLGFDLAEDGETIMAGPDFRRDGLTTDRGIEKKVEIRSIPDIQIPGGRRRKRLLPRRTFYGIIKRVTDFSVALLAIIFLMPFLLFLAIVILIDDGFPLFFGHKRQARGGREFKCYKFRTMRRDAESLVKELQALNKADGPQVFIENDPRVTRVGAFMRKFQLDELPQFWNVIKGDMSFVGPRPSPDRENQFCPAWRELRLSVRPGITGLWQVNRTRAPGEDFQEWIRYDIEYVRTASLMGDLKIILRTVRGLIIRG
ncbi:MAG: sugar transferase [Phycisphaerales bacterium]